MKQIEHAERKHSTLGASGSHRWLRCPGSVALEAKAPPEIENPWAKAGTEAHEHLEKCLQAFVKKKSVQFDVEEGWAIKMAFDYITAGLTPRHTLAIEEKVDLEFIDPVMFGTIDAAKIEPWGTLEVIDYKHGKAAVSPVENTQLIYYAIGLAQKYDWEFSDIKLTIIQPRSESDCQISSWDISTEKLFSYIDLFKKGVKRTKEPNAKLFAGEHCKYCRATVLCPEITNKGLEKARLEFSDIQKADNALPHPNDLDPDQITEILKVSKRLDIWLNDVKSYATDFLKRGGKLDGFHLVPTRPQRLWKDEDKAAKDFAKVTREAFTVDLKSPAQMEKLKSFIKGFDMKGLVAKHVVSVSSGEKIEEIKEIEFKELKNGSSSKTRSENNKRKKDGLSQNDEVSSQLSKRVSGKSNQSRSRA